MSRNGVPGGTGSVVGPQDQQEAGADSLPSKPRRRRGWVLWTSLGLLVVLVSVLGALGRSASDDGPLSPGSPAPDGAMAAAQVLREQGVTVHVPGSYGQALQALSPGATLLLDDPNGWVDADRLQLLAAEAGRVVLLRPDFTQLEALAPQISPAGVVPSEDGSAASLAADCGAADPAAADTIDAGGRLYRGPVTCFPVPGGPDDAGSYAATSNGSVVVLGNSRLLANSVIAERGNAALVLRTLGAHEELVWFAPTAADYVPEDTTAAGPPLPGWVIPTAAWLVIVAVIAAFRQGRRLGPLAVEPMPVLVRSSETAEGRARLYQDGRASHRAGQVLRSGTKVRLARFLRLPAVTGPNDLVFAVAAAASRPVEEIAALLNGPLPAGDAELVRWAQTLQKLEEEVTGE